MDPTEQDFGTLSSAHVELRNISDNYSDLDTFVNNLHRDLVKSGEFEANLRQINHVSHLVAMTSASPDRTMKYFFKGQIIALGLLNQLHGPETDKISYKAMNELYLYARKRVFKNKENRQLSTAEFEEKTGLVIKQMLEEDICFDAIDAREEHSLSNLFEADVTDEEQGIEDYFDLTRGYRLARMADTWYKRRVFLKKSDQATNIRSESEMSPDEISSALSSIALQNELDSQHIETLDSCDDDLNTLISKLTQHIADLDYPDIFDPNVTEDIQAKLDSLIIDDFIQLENLKFLDDITVVGNIAALLYDQNGNLLLVNKLPNSATVRGTIRSVKVTRMPPQKWIDTRLKSSKTSIAVEDLDYYCLAFWLDPVEIILPDGTVAGVSPNETLLLGVEYDEVQIWRDPFSQVNN